DLKERQRLREQMDMLDIKRNENIAKKKAASRQKFLKHVFWLKQEDERIKKVRDVKLAAEREQRIHMKEESEQKIEEADNNEKEKQRHRRKNVEAKEERYSEQDSEDYRQLRARWKVRDKEKSKAIGEARERQAKANAAAKTKAIEEKSSGGKIGQRRQAAWTSRDDRIKRKDSEWLKRVLEIKAERLRTKKMMEERNQESLRIQHELRQPIFAAQLLRTSEREKAVEAVQKAQESYTEKRSLPKKVKKKGKFAQQAAGTQDPKAGKKPDKISDTDKVLDAVEAKMRAEMEEQGRRSKLDDNRTQKIVKANKARELKCKQHMAEIRQSYRDLHSAAEAKASERKIIHSQKEVEMAGAEERKKQELARLCKLREQNILKRESARIAAMAA
ncbi:unnamed protein product, partial [Polarella glacialis]